MKHTIFNNYYSADAAQDAREYLFEELATEKGWSSADDIPDELVWDEIYFIQEMNWDDTKIELEHFFDGGDFLVYGTFGGWRGRQAAGKIIHNFLELAEAWKDCDYINLYDENGHFYIECSHHDGTNLYEVKRITNKGMELLDPWNEHDQETHEKIFNCNLFSALPHFAHTVYGCKKYA